MSENLWEIEQRIRRYQDRKDRADRIVFWAVMVIAGVLLAMGYA